VQAKEQRFAKDRALLNEQVAQLHEDLQAKTESMFAVQREKNQTV
jgi:outer membrane murein-binding lipoprotein Lpp